MFDLDMGALRQTARLPWLMANPANLANPANAVANPMPAAANGSQPLAKLAEIAKLAISQHRLTALEISQQQPHLAKLAGLAISHDLLTTRLMAAAMRRCDYFKDSAKARQDMREQILETPPHDRQDLLDYFTAQTQQKAQP